MRGVRLSLENLPLKWCSNLQCRKLLVWRPEDRPSDFLRRKCCDVPCRMAAVNQRRDRMVKCVACPVLVSTRSNFGVVRCPACTRKQDRKFKKRARDKLVSQSKNYRILMASLGWPTEQFEDLLEYLETVPWAFLDEKRIRDLRSAA